MPTHPTAPDDVHDLAEELRTALKDNGITLPSLGVDLPSFAGSYGVPLVALGNCNAATAHQLAEVLRKAATR
jgi:acetylornithine deacetylase/succinyl-diaminopimelate desuccinylase-like protein